MTEPDRVLQPGSEAAQPSTAALTELLAPFCELALAQGVKLQSLIDLLKLGLVDAAQVLAAEQASAAPGERSDSPLSDSQLSVMTGVHRKDLRALRDAGAARPARPKNLAAEVFARWLSDPQYLTRKGQPRVLPRHKDASDAPNFERLVEGVSKDVHPRSVLDELLRLKLIDCRGETVRVVSNSFTPSEDLQAQLQILAANSADHLRAGRANLARGGKAFLEQAIYADELSAQSAEQFNRLTLGAWEQAFERLMPQLRELFKDDQSNRRAMTHRVRFGMYGYVDKANTQRDRQDD